MSFVDVGSIRSKSFTFNVMHSGESEVNIDLNTDLFPENSNEWLVGIQSLSAPLDSTRFLDETKPNLFHLLRVRHNTAPTPQNTFMRGRIADSDLDVGVVGDDNQKWTHDATTLRHDRTPCLEFGDLMQQMVDWCGRVNTLINSGLDGLLFNTVWDTGVEGIGDDLKNYAHLRVRIGSSGMISLIGSHLFFANFMIQVTPYMQALTNLPALVGYNVNTNQLMTAFPLAGPNMDYNVNLRVPEGAGANPELHQDNYKIYNIVGDRSLWGSCDTRLSISVSTNLPLKRSYTVTDDKICRDFTLGSFDLNNEVQVTQRITDQISSVFDVTSLSRAGHTALKPSGPPHYWVEMSSGRNIRNIKMKLMIRERRWNPITDTWSIIHKTLPLEKHQTWQCCLIFAKKTH